MTRSEASGLSNNLAKRIKRIDSLLVEMYGTKHLKAEGDPLDALIETVLSQNTSDTNRDRAFQSLKSRFPSWHDVMEADTKEVADAIRSGGLADIKSARIQNILREIYRERGSLDLSFLNDLPVEEAFRFLTGFPGVGVKTASCVLLFSLGRPVFPVDTHVHRLSLRLGLVPPGTDKDGTHYLLAEVIPDGIVYQLHINMIEHGRKRCKARNPQCGTCLLQPECLYYSKAEA